MAQGQSLVGCAEAVGLLLPFPRRKGERGRESLLILPLPDGASPVVWLHLICPLWLSESLPFPGRLQGLCSSEWLLPLLNFCSFRPYTTLLLWVDFALILPAVPSHTVNAFWVGPRPASQGKLVVLVLVIAHLVQEDMDRSHFLQLSSRSLAVIMTVAIREVILIAKL